MTAETESFQLTLEAAEMYEAAFVPAFFAQWAPILCSVAGVGAAGSGPGQRVLDVACGTGIVARTAADRMGGAGHVVGVDLNEAMLTVARRVRPELEWRQADAATLGLPDASVDVVLCQMALMFFPDKVGALAEMRRVLRPDGTIALLVPAALDQQPAFSPLLEMIAGYAGPAARSLLSTYFVCGEIGALTAMAEAAGLAGASGSTHLGTYGSPSVEAAVRTELDSTPLGARIDPDTLRRILADAEIVLRPFTEADGTLRAPFACHSIVARRPR